jgi:outer membrane receptor protein involved in Fe transport
VINHRLQRHRPCRTLRAGAPLARGPKALVLCSWLAIESIASGAHAQDVLAQAPADARPAATQEQAATQERSAPPRTQPQQLEPVIVTARRRLENVQDAPVVMTTLTADRIDRYSIRSLEDMQAATPGLIVTRGSSGSGADLRLRGIGTTFSSIGIEQSVAVIIDGVYYGQGRVLNEALEDVSRIEVLKGPQALFFGKNSTAGVVSITTEDPGTQFEVKARAGYEFRSRERTGLFVISGPVTDTIGLRLALDGRHMSGGYVRNEAVPGIYTTTDAVTGIATPHVVPAPADRDLPGNRSLFARLTGTYAPTNDLKLTLKGTAGRMRTGSYTWNNKPWRCPAGFPPINPTEPCGDDFTVQQNPVPPEIAATRPDLNRYGGQLYTLYTSSGLTGRVEYTGDKFTLTSITNGQYSKFSAADDYDFTGGPAIFADENNNYHAFSEELRLQTRWDTPVNYMLGLFYQRTKLKFAQAGLILGSEDSSAETINRYATLTKRSTTRGETKSIYGQAIWTPVPAIEAAAGARYTDESKKSFFVQPYVNPFFTGVYALNNPIDLDQHFHDLSPEASLRWKPAEDLMVYGAWKEGYKSGGFSNSANQVVGIPADTLAFKPETVRGFEAGIKTTLLDKRLHVNLAAYRYVYSDLQLEFFNAPTIALVSTNIGSATTRGLELDAEFLPPGTRGLRLRGSVQHNIARYRDFIGPCYAGQTQAQGCDRLGPPPSNTPLQDLSGKRLAGAPKWTGSLGFDFDHPVPRGLVLGVSANVLYSSSYSTSPVAQPLDVQSSYTRLDAAIRLQSEDRRSELALIGRNLTNQFVATYGSDAPLSGTPPGGTTGTLAHQTGAFLPPRTVELQFTWRY